MTQKELIRQEIERRKKYESENYHDRKADGRPNEGWAESLAIMGELEELLSFIDSLPEEKQKPVEIHLDNPNIQKHDPDVKITTSDSSAGGDELLYVCNKSYNIGFRDGVNSVAPAEWGQSRLTVEDIKTILDISFWNNDPQKILEEYNRLCDTSKVTRR